MTEQSELNQLKEVKKIIKTILCRNYHKNGVASRMSEGKLKDEIAIIHVDKFGYAPAEGEMDVSLFMLENERSINSRFGEYYVTSAKYLKWLNEKDVTEPNIGGDWSPVKIDDYETLTGQLDELEANLSGENGYVSEYPFESEYAIDTTRSLSKSLKDNEGTTLKKRFQDFLFILKQLDKIFDATTRIGKLLKTIMSLVTSLFQS